MTGQAPGGPLVDAHLASLAMRGYRPRTLHARGSFLQTFARTLDGRPLEQATRRDIETYLGRPLRPESRRAYRGHLIGFFRWALDEGIVDTDPTARLAPVRVPKGVPRPLLEADLLTALAAGSARMSAWLLLMALGGLRCVEVSHLRPEDVTPHGDRSLLFLRECKGGGTATVPAHPMIVRALEQLPIRNGVWWECSPRTVSTQVRLHLRAAGNDATAHQLRHFAGTAWYRESGHDLLATAALMRHRNVATTMIYAQLDPSRGADVVHSVGLGGMQPHPPAPPAADARPVLRLVRDAG